MPRYICKLDGMYFEWSTIVDSPVTHGMSLDELERYYKQEYGRSDAPALHERLVRTEAKGTSSHLHASIDELIEGNRAGDDESEATRAEIVAMLREGAARRGDA